MMKAVRHAGIVVSDLAKSLRFYRDLLGLRIAKQKEESGEYIDAICGLKNARINTVKLAAGDGSLIELLYFYSHLNAGRGKSDIFDIGISHVAFMVEDVDKEYDRLSKAGVLFNSPPKVSPDGYAKVAFCKDPDGVFVELTQVLEKK